MQHVLSWPCRGYSSAAACSLAGTAKLQVRIPVNISPRTLGRRKGFWGVPALKDCSARILGMVSSTVLQSAGKFRERSTLGAGLCGVTPEPALPRSADSLLRIRETVSNLHSCGSHHVHRAPRLDVVPCGPSVTSQAVSCQFSRQSHTFGRATQMVTAGSKLQIPVARVATVSPEEVKSIAQCHTVGHARPRARCRHTLKTWLDSARESRKNQ